MGLHSLLRRTDARGLRRHHSFILLIHLFAQQVGLTHVQHLVTTYCIMNWATAQSALTVARG